MNFEGSNLHTIGMELEFQLLDARTLDLVDGILPLMDLYPGSANVKPEVIQNTVEVASKVCGSLPELDAHLRRIVTDLQEKCWTLSMTLCGAGTHPFGRRLALITPQPRYLQMEQQEGLPAHTQITFAAHVHLGMSSGEEAIRVMGELRAYLPLLIAASANSPFWRGYDTGHACYRQHILAAARTYGIPPSFGGWDEFAHFFDVGRKANVFETIRDIHWDIRPQPSLGTLEVRLMDMQPTVGEAIDLAAFARVLGAYLARVPQAERPTRLPRPLPWWFERQNHYQAAHLGLAATCIHDKEGSLVPMATLFDDVSKAISELAEELGLSPQLERLRRRVEAGVGYVRQRRVWHDTQSMQKVVAALTRELTLEAASRTRPESV
jgi:carboxylate-amine ligase